MKIEYSKDFIKEGERYILVCKENNDLYRVLREMGKTPLRYDLPEAAINSSPKDSGILILADGYPEQTTEIQTALIDKAISKNIRLFIEYPAALQGMEIKKPKAARFERLVINSDFFEPFIKKDQILSINALYFTPVKNVVSYIAAARVAGFNSAVLGLPELIDPILFPYPKGNILISTTKLSHFVSGRYGPQQAWRFVWQSILGKVYPGQEHQLNYTPIVLPAYTKDEILPKDVEKKALKRGIEWFINSKLLIHPSRKKEIDDAVVENKNYIPAPPNDAPVGDGSLGILEAPLSIIGSDGNQMQSISLRSDCTGESAMALAFGGTVFSDNKKSTIAQNLLDYWYFKTEATKNERGDPKHGAYGLISWGITSPAWYTANYGDDNARLMMGTMAAAALLKNDSWDEPVMRCLLANLRTAGKFGFRDDRIDLPGLSEKGWRYFFERDIVSYSPHMECYLWACYLWAYHKTGYELFYTKAETALRMTMKEYTDGWRWTNGLAQEKARIILPLAWLIRVKDTPEHREWLNKSIDGLLALQQPCGAIREELGLPGKGMFPPPDSNETYGEHEAPLIQQNGDPVSDLLYTTNFALLGLHEASLATKDSKIIDAEDKLIKFLCRIQVRSDKLPALDGGWFRAFDYSRWEAWASNADAGWGAWAIESGWTQAWITSVIAMRQMNTSLWNLTSKSKISDHFEKYRKIMIPNDVK